jgi:hypothetical protein
MDKVGGFEFLGVGTSDNRGDYEITFYDWQYDRAERKKADVVIYAAEEAQNSFRLIGRSRMVNSTDYGTRCGHSGERSAHRVRAGHERVDGVPEGKLYDARRHLHLQRAARIHRRRAGP